MTVVVDYGPLDGGVEIGCDPEGGGKPAAQVVTDAGFDLHYVSSQPGFVCRIDGLPGEGDEDCADTPPADAFWGLFWSDADPETWSYSNEGAGSLDVPEGGSIGWRFQDGGDREVPSAPPTQRKEPRSPQPPASPSPQPSDPPAAATPSPTPSASVPPDAGGPSNQPGEEAGPADRTSGDRAGREEDEERAGPGKGPGKGNDKPERPRGDDARQRLVSPGPSPTVAALNTASSEPETSSGSSTTLTLLAGSLVLLLAGAAGFMAWRRRV